MSGYTKPYSPQAGQEVKADHMISHARAIEELQRRLGGEVGQNKTYRGGNSSAFCRKYLLEDSIMLLGGVVTGGVGNITVPSITLATVGSEPADDTHVWLEVSFTAYIEDDVLLPGGDVTAVSTGSGATLPDNVIPTVADPSGTLYISLGSWALSRFIPVGCGDFQISHCLGVLSYFRS